MRLVNRGVGRISFVSPRFALRNGDGVMDGRQEITHYVFNHCVICNICTKSLFSGDVIIRSVFRTMSFVEARACFNHVYNSTVGN